MSMIQLALKNVFSKPLNLLLSMVLFGLGIGLINFLILLNHQLKEQFENNLAGIDLVIGAKGSPLQMILCNMYHVDNPTGNISVKEATPFLNPKHPLIKKVVPLSLGDSHKGYRIVGSDHSIFELYKAEPEQGKLWERDFEVTVGKAVADDLHIHIGDRFHSSHGFMEDEDMLHEHGEGFKVVGILKPTGSIIDQLIVSNSKSIWDVHDHDHDDHDHGEDGHAHGEGDHSHDDGHAHGEDDHSHEGHDHSHDGHHHHDVPVEASNPESFDLREHPDKAITSLLIQFKNRTNFQALNLPRNINENTDMQSASPAYEINRLYSMIGVGVDAIRNLAYLIALVSAFSIFISLYNSLKDRKYELALMRVMGAGQGKLFFLIILEGIILAILGSIFGFVISHIGMEVFARFAKSSYKYSLTGFTFLSKEWIIFAAALVIGIIAAVIPAIQAYRTQIHNTLSK